MSTAAAKRTKARMVKPAAAPVVAVNGLDTHETGVFLGISEKQFQEVVCDLAHYFGWRLQYHTYDSRRSPRGFPDEVFVRPPRVIFAELKRERGKLSPAQTEWLAGLARCPGVEAYCWFPSDWDSIVRVLR